MLLSSFRTSYSAAAVLLAVAAGSGSGAFAFAPLSTLHQHQQKSTELQYTIAESDAEMDIVNNIQSYLTEPEAVEARNNIDGTCLVSGLVLKRPSDDDDEDDDHRPDWSLSDQFLFDLLNHEDSAFEFDSICVYGSDSKFAKKRLLSRSARYTGLLDKLDYRQGESALPQADQLDGVTTWLAVIEGGDHLQAVQEIAATCKLAHSVENVAILLTEANQLDARASQAALEDLQGNDSLSYTVVTVGRMENTPEGGKPYDFQKLGTEKAVLPEESVFSRQEAFRVITELLQLECGKNKALSFGEVYSNESTNTRLIKALRKAGYTRAHEVDHMMNKGPEAYHEAVEQYKAQVPDDPTKSYTTDAWWMGEIYQKSRQEAAAREEEKKKEQRDGVAVGSP